MTTTTDVSFWPNQINHLKFLNMNLSGQWVNSHNSLMTIHQDPSSGYITGTYSSSTGGTGTYDVIGWSSLNPPTSKAGQTVSLSILWRSNDGGKSDPSHEVSAMTGQLVVKSGKYSLVLIHAFVETKADVKPSIGTYPDKLVFKPYIKPAKKVRAETTIAELINQPDPIDRISGIWKGLLNGQNVELSIKQMNPTSTEIQGLITYDDQFSYSINGFTDIFAASANFQLQGLTFSTFIDLPDERICIGVAGWFNLDSSIIQLTQLKATSTANDSLWYQVEIGYGQLLKS